jgi:hypothetical protein
MPKRCSTAVYPTRRNVLEGVQYLAIGCLSAVVFDQGRVFRFTMSNWAREDGHSNDSTIHRDRRFRIDKVALEFSGLCTMNAQNHRC